MSHDPTGALPQRGGAERCTSTAADARRCVLPPGHQGWHVYPLTATVAQPSHS